MRILACTLSLIAFAFAAAAVPACVSDQRLATDGSPKMACVFREGACLPPTAGTSCCGQTGFAYDEARDCRVGVEQIIACLPEAVPSVGACVMTGAVGCAITMDGTTRRVWSTPGRARGWKGAEECSSELYERVIKARPCSSDAGVDSDTGATTYEADDFESWRWRWVGTGMAGSFAMDRDCGIDAEGTLSYFGGPPTGSGVVAADECTTFKTLAVSSQVTSAFAKYGASGAVCAPVTDDYTTAVLTVRDGVTHAVTWASGCSDVEPFKKLRTEMTRLGSKYIVPASDASTDGD